MECASDPLGSPFLQHSFGSSIERDGFAVVDQFLDYSDVRRVLGFAPEARLDRAGTRQLQQQIPELNEFLRVLIKRLGVIGFPVRTILFDKTPERNWGVPWHQDRTICVRERHEVRGFGPWSIKEGVVHVQPPATILENMITVRFHLDSCGEENGPLQVIASSHRNGFLNTCAIAEWKSAGAMRSCLVGRGGVVLMKPLLLHSSKPAKSPGHRRVLHVECATGPLPHPLQWIE
jgi:hypothetical protein